MKKLSARTKLTYAVGNLGYGTLAQTVGSFIMFFGTSVLGISGTLVGLAVALSTFWDGISDPLVGYLSDRTYSKTFGKRLGFMLVATFGMALVNIMLWIIPSDISMGGKFAWLLASLLALETFNTMFATPYVALGMDIAPGYNEQSSVQGFKTVFFILGMILPSVLMFMFMGNNSNQLNQMGYINIAYVNSMLAVATGAICILGTVKTVQGIKLNREKRRKGENFFKIFYNFILTLKKKNHGAVIIGYSVALIAAAFLTAVGLHVFTYSYHFSSKQIPILMTVLFIGAIASQPLWIYLSKRLDKKPTLNISLVLVIVAIALIFFTFIIREFIAVEIMFYLVLPCIFLCGFGTGALYSLPISMFADVIQVEKAESGEDKTGTYSGYMTLAYNIANSVALLLIGILLDLIKFDSAQPVQAASVQNGLGLIMFIGCALSISASILIFSRYTLKRSEVLKSQLKRKK